MKCAGTVGTRGEGGQKDNFAGKEEKEGQVRVRESVARQCLLVATVGSVVPV